jgi:pimeloyl-ACP methyl ester carboxylesterase
MSTSSIRPKGLEYAMRLSARRQGHWSRFGEYRNWDSQLLFSSAGTTEVVRLGQGEPIVLVPGLAGGWKLLAPLALHLAKRYEVILYGLRGESTPLVMAEEETIGHYARDLGALLDQLQLERPTLFGVSFGGAVALELAATNPGRLSGLVVMGAEARFRVSFGSKIALRVLERFPLPSQNQFINQFFNILHGGKPEPGPLAQFIVDRCWETDQGVMARRLRALESHDVSDRLWQIDVPTLVLAGTRDVIVPWERQRALAAAIPGGRFEALEGAGHIGFLTHKAEIDARIRRLISHRARTLC